MTDQPFYSPAHTTAPRQPWPGELLWSIPKEGRELEAELRDHGQWGVEVQIFKDGEFLNGRRGLNVALGIVAVPQLVPIFWPRNGLCA
jgi:hypothetical protein